MPRMERIPAIAALLLAPLFACGACLPPPAYTDLENITLTSSGAIFLNLERVSDE